MEQYVKFHVLNIHPSNLRNRHWYTCSLILRSIFYKINFFISHIFFRVDLLLHKAEGFQNLLQKCWLWSYLKVLSMPILNFFCGFLSFYSFYFWFICLFCKFLTWTVSFFKIFIITFWIFLCHFHGLEIQPTNICFHNQSKKK